MATRGLACDGRNHRPGGSRALDGRPAAARGIVIATVLIMVALVQTAAARAADGVADASVAGPGSPSATAGPPGPMPYWRAPALPTAVIQGGAIPPGWQPQAVPYHGIGPDGQPLTMYFAPTYVFTFQSGPPVLAVPQVQRSGGWVPATTTAPPAQGGWNYATTGVPPVQPALPPAAVNRY